MRVSRVTVFVIALGLLVVPPSRGAEPNAWYWDSPVNIHWDNHGRPLGQGMTPEEIAKLFEGLDVDMIQVSARSGYTTYPSRVGVPNPALDGYDTMATWREVTQRLGKRMWVYINVIDAPHLVAEHPDWRRVDAKGNKSKVCNRPSADGSGWLEQYAIPLVREIVDRYEPDGFWFDGDWQIPKVCYCDNCKAAWKAATGNAEPPKEASNPDWPQWVTLEQERLDGYKRKLAAAIHDADPDCNYVSNWSWAISHRDPRTPPAWADALSGDVGAGSSRGALYGLRFAASMLSAQEHTPHDLMSAIYPKKVRTLPRMLQEGGLVMSSGTSWFLWVNQLAPEQFDHLRACYGLVNARRKALGRTQSVNPVAVLLSETTWEHGLASEVAGYFDHQSPRNWAFALQDAYYGVDVVNEQTLREQTGRWRVVVVANQRRVRPDTLDVLRQFVERGGTLVITDGGLFSTEKELPGVVELLGVVRTPRAERALAGLSIGETTIPVHVPWMVEPHGAKVRAKDVPTDAPVLTVRRVGRGQVAYLALADVSYPDEDGLARWLMEKLRLGPMVSVSGEARANHLVFSIRRRDERQLVLHVSDLTTFADNQRIEPNSSHEIDAIRPIPKVELQVPMASAPTSVQVVPEETQVEWAHQDDMLNLVLSDFRVHAAVVLNVTHTEPLGLLPPHTQPAPLRGYATSPVILDENFDSTAIGKFPDNPVWSANVDAKTAIRVTRDPASPDNRVLEFVDAPDARKRFIPYLVMQPRGLNRGRARFSCRLYLEPGASVNVEARDAKAGSYAIGPSIRISEDGEVMAAGRTLTTVPTERWLQLELEFGLAFHEPYCRLKIVQPGKPQQQFDQLPYVDPKFTACTWLGIVSLTTKKTHFYVDDVKLQRLPTGERENGNANK
jgi:hypothetical protein